MIFTYTIETIHAIANEIITIAKQQKVWLLHGQMGAGKTTLVQAFCKALQVTDAVSSPTFSIINEYYSNSIGTIYHMDWYRISSEAEAINAGIEDALYNNCYCWVEWPSIVPSILPTEVCNIHITLINETTRQIKISFGKPIFP